MSGDVEVIEPRLARRCAAERVGERPCRAAPLRDSAFCFWHDPLRAEDAAAARALGGKRRRRQTVVAAGYDVVPLDSAAGIRRILEIAMLDVLPLENSVARARVLIAAAQAARRLLEVEALAHGAGVVPSDGSTE